jgi:hypothetical protein
MITTSFKQLEHTSELIFFYLARVKSLCLINQIKSLNRNDLNALEKAFGPSMKNELLTSYDGSSIVSDNQQDLIGERYISEQIKYIQQKKTSIVDKYAHLFYEGEKDYKPSEYNPQKFITASSANLAVKPVQQQHFVLNNNSETKIKPLNKPNN